MGFIYVPPYRIQGISVAGEETVVQVPELDVCFDVGLAPRRILSSRYVALSHGHMDHSAGLAYYFSQRHFQGMGTGTVICHRELERPLQGVMRAWIDLEAQRTPYNLVPLAPDEEMLIKGTVYLRAFATNHTVHSIGFVVIERRSKLKPELLGLPQQELVHLKNQGRTITDMHDIPLVCYTGDTMWGKHFDRPDVLNAKILITECTFMDRGDRSRAAVGQHLHLNNIVDLLQRSHAEAVILTHLSRRTNLNDARQLLNSAISESDRSRVHLLMDHRTNQRRYEGQQAEAAAAASVMMTHRAGK